ncbi:hypothetical protein HanIR_Chr07g0320631 [Helianthus annuus]|nr:hypothetical protein HanIR_Chr07g0320631 [Helianthus annuus]
MRPPAIYKLCERRLAVANLILFLLLLLLLLLLLVVIPVYKHRWFLEICVYHILIESIDRCIDIVIFSLVFRLINIKIVMSYSHKSSVLMHLNSDLQLKK